MENQPIRLTQYAKGAGCGCKIAPAILEQMLSHTLTRPSEALLVGNHTRDDAAVYDLGNGTALVVTADFFMPIVDDAFTFGKIAAANALSDVYAMGANPITAIALLGWPVDKLPPELAAKVLEGAAAVCTEAGLVISGGHTIESPEPFFGLSVNGLAPVSSIKRNNTGKPGDRLLLTKPIGVGILATAQKRGLITDPEADEMIAQMTSLNKFGALLGNAEGVTAMTDVTGFGLLGHTLEMLADTNLSAVLEFDRIPVLPAAEKHALAGVIPDATYRNWNTYCNDVNIGTAVDPMRSFTILPDPQTNGGLLIAVDPKHLTQIQELAARQQVNLFEIGCISGRDTHPLMVR